MTVYTRWLRREDLAEVLQISQWLHENSRYKVFSYNEDKVKHLLSLSLSSNSPVFVVVCVLRETNEIIGYFHGYVDEHYFSNMKYAGEWAVCILPEFRKYAPKALKKMVLAFEKWAKSMDAEEVSIAASTEAAGTGYKKFLKRMGYRDVGFLAVKEG